MASWKTAGLTTVFVAAMLVWISMDTSSLADDRVMDPTQSVDTLVAPQLEMMDNIAENAKMLRMDLGDLKVRFDKILLISDGDELRKQLEGVQRTLIMLERRTQSHWKSCEELYSEMKADQPDTVQVEKKER